MGLPCFRLSKELDLPLPEMVFGHNELRLENSNGFVYSINAVDALKLVDNCHEPLKVAYSAQWKASRCGERASLTVAGPVARERTALIVSIGACTLPPNVTGRRSRRSTCTRR